MTREALLLDLKALHQGRGIRRPRVRSWLGPQLLALLQATPDNSDAELRVALARLLARHSQPLPRDLRYLFRVAVGLEMDLPLLEGRMIQAAEALDRRIRACYVGACVKLRSWSLIRCSTTVMEAGTGGTRRVGNGWGSASTSCCVKLRS